MTDEKLLYEPIAFLGMTEKFVKGCEAMGFATINEIMEIDPKDLVKRDGFDYKWLAELVSYLDGKGMLHLLQQ